MFKNIAIAEDFYAIWEAFLSLLPVALAINVLIMLFEFSHLFQDVAVGYTDILNGHELDFLYSFLLPLFFNLAFSNLLAKAKNLEPLSTSLIAMVCFFRGSGFLRVTDDSIFGADNGSIFTSIIFTWSAIKLLQYLTGIPKLKPFRTESISPLLAKNLNLLFPAILTILCFELLGTFLTTTITPQAAPILSKLLPDFSSLSDLQELILYKVIALGAWLVGMHGEKFSDGLLASVYGFPMLRSPNGAMLENLHIVNLHNVFMNIGGSGSTFVIPFLILKNKRLHPFHEIGQISTFFTLFNVNEVLLFGLPIALNPVFILPFCLAPLANMAITSFMVQQGLFSIDHVAVSWMTPPIYSAYLVSGGAPWAILTQIFCICMDGCIYWPFLILASRQRQAPSALKKLFSDENYGYLDRILDNKQEQLFTLQQTATLRKLTRTQQVTAQLKNSRLQVYYQPKVDAQTLEVSGFEAMLRLQNRQGHVYEPAFLPVLYRQGLSKFIDRRMIDLVFDHILHWRSLGFQVPPISLNLDRDFLCDPKVVQTLIQEAQKHHIMFTIEITENSYAMAVSAIQQAVQRLSAAGHYVAIDHFGTGYAALETLVNLAVHEVKLAQEIVVIPYNTRDKGRRLLEGTVQLCHSLGFKVSAEGIESLEHLKQAQNCGVDILQGGYFGMPISHEKMEVFLANPTYEAAT